MHASHFDTAWQSAARNGAGSEIKTEKRSVLSVASSLLSTLALYGSEIHFVPSLKPNEEAQSTRRCVVSHEARTFA